MSDVPHEDESIPALPADPEQLKGAHGTYANYLQKAGLPFEPEDIAEADEGLEEE